MRSRSSAIQLRPRHEPCSQIVEQGFRPHQVVAAAAGREPSRIELLGGRDAIGGRADRLRLPWVRVPAAGHQPGRAGRAAGPIGLRRVGPVRRAGPVTRPPGSAASPIARNDRRTTAGGDRGSRPSQPCLRQGRSRSGARGPAHPAARFDGLRGGPPRLPGRPGRAGRRRATDPGPISRSAMPHRVAALRELFEEAGVLVAGRTKQAADPRAGPVVLDAPLPAADLPGLRAALAAGRARSARASSSVHDLVLATDRLVPIARWQTPRVYPRRFDTRFFAVELSPARSSTSTRAR